jgi:hypothetical protein
MDADNQEFLAGPKPGDEGARTRQFTRRIDCAPTPRRPDPLQPPGGPGSPRAPAEDV